VLRRKSRCVRREIISLRRGLRFCPRKRPIIRRALARPFAPAHMQKPIHARLPDAIHSLLGIRAAGICVPLWAVVVEEGMYRLRAAGEWRFSRVRCAGAAVVLLVLWALFGGVHGGAQTATPGLSVSEIVQRLVERNRERVEWLRHYTGKRHYHLVYRGFPSGREATMDVEVAFDAPSKKTFTVTSESGSKMLADRVFRRLIDSEKEATLDPARSALTPENYAFDLDGVEGRDYVLRVTPRGDNKYLYRGKIWVDAEDFAVSRIDAEPAKNPSFWIKKTEIHHRYGKVGEFWLPMQNQTETKTRLGGVADLTIDYSDYVVAER
jgi:outer membrane lipoprotein-sorting protein